MTENQKSRPSRLTIEPAVDGGYVVNDNYNCLFAGSLKEALAYIEGRFDPEARVRALQDEALSAIIRATPPPPFDWNKL